MSDTIIKKTEFYTLRRTGEGFVVELDSAALSGVKGLTNISIHDTCEIKLTMRATNIVNEAICPKDPVVRKLLAVQRRVYQQSLLLQT